MKTILTLQWVVSRVFRLINPLNLALPVCDLDLVLGVGLGSVLLTKKLRRNPHETPIHPSNPYPSMEAQAF